MNMVGLKLVWPDPWTAKHARVRARVGLLHGSPWVLE
jgi:hypothetical protein